VEVHNYIDDLGNQLADTVVGLLYHPLRKECARFSDYCWDLYAKVNQAYKEDKGLEEKRSMVLHELEEGHSNVAWIGYLVAERIVRDHLQELAEFNIDYDLLVWEGNIVREGFWNTAFEQLQKSNQFVKETEGKTAGCWVLKQENRTEEDAMHQLDKVLVRSNGILTYTAKDIAYHLWKFGLLEKDFTYQPFKGSIWTTNGVGEKRTDYGNGDIVLNVIDKRQEYPQQMVKLALETLGHTEAAKSLKHVSYGVVSLSRDTAHLLGVDTSDHKTAYAMSGRQGVGIKIAELLDRMEKVIEEKRARKSGISSRDIATAAVRYFLLRYALNTEIVFDMDQATEVSGNTGVYLLYSYTRGYNILEKAGAVELGIPKGVDISQLHPSEHALMRHMITWPEVIVATLEDMSPNLICNYGFQLASLFNNFYASCPVMKEENEQRRQYRLWLTATFKKNLGEVLDILGLPIPTEM
jgi:arginyl-tRNA synthetase